MKISLSIIVMEGTTNVILAVVNLEYSQKERMKMPKYKKKEIRKNERNEQRKTRDSFLAFC